MKKNYFGLIPPPKTPDPNLAAKERFLADKSTDAVNLGIGEIMDKDGNTWNQATAYVDTMQNLIQEKGYFLGSYITPDPDLLEKSRQFILELLNIPKKVWPYTVVEFTSGGGTSALGDAVDFLKMQYPLKELNVQNLSWPGYKSIATRRNLQLKTIPINISEFGDCNILQPCHNSTGYILQEKEWRQYAKEQKLTIVDIPYLGFEYAHLPYAEALKKSTSFIETFLECDAPLMIAFSPTKIFNTFYARPGGVFIAICRSAEEKQNAQGIWKTVSRGGSGFMSLTTYALIATMAQNKTALLKDHENLILRVQEAARDWSKFAQGDLKKYFTKDYGGMFRAFQATDNAALTLADQHIHVVDNGQKTIRIAITGLPQNDKTESIVQKVSKVTME